MRQSRGNGSDEIIDWAPRPAPQLQGPSSGVVRNKYKLDWRLVKRASFNAAKRFHLKQEASTISFAIAGLLDFLVPMYSLIFADAVTPNHKNVLDFSSYVSGALALVLGLIEQSKDYAAKSRKFHQRGLSVNKVIRRVSSFDQTAEYLDRLVEDYEAALDNCGENHDNIDYEIASTQERLNSKDAKEDNVALRKLGWLRFKEGLSIYGLYAAVTVFPCAIGA